MSMRRGVRSFRIPRTNPDEYAAFIQQIGETILHQLRDNTTKCPDCWDEYAGGYASGVGGCPTCHGSGYLPKFNRLTAFVSIGRPHGNPAVANQTFRGGGQHLKYSAWIYTGYKEGVGVKDGDRLIVNQSGIREEFVVMNRDPQRGAGVTIGWTFECGSASNKELGFVKL
jgi:hypothetical protein